MQVFLYNVHKTVVAVDRLKEMQGCTCVGTVQQWCIHLSLTIKKLCYCSFQHQDETVTRICSLFSNWICHPIGPTCSFSVFHCWLGGRKGIRPVKNWVVGCWQAICLQRGADLYASVKSRLVLPFWYRLTRVVREKGPLNVHVCVVCTSELEQFFCSWCDRL